MKKWIETSTELSFPTKGKIFLLRHLPVLNDENKALYDRQKKKVVSLLDNPNGRWEYQILADCDDVLSIDPAAISANDLQLYDILFWSDGATLILPPKDECKLRIKESIDWVLDRYPHIKLYHVKTGINPRKDGSRVKSLSDAWAEVDKVTTELSISFSEWSTYILFWSRSHASSFMLSGGFGDYSSNDAEKEFEAQGYLSWDIGTQNSSKSVIITPECFDTIREFISSQINDLLSLQNHLNKTLHESPEMTRNYLLNKSAPTVLQRSCFVLCLERGDINTIEAFADQQNPNQLDSFYVEQLISKHPKTHGLLMNYLAHLTQHERGALKPSFDNLNAPELYNSLLEKAAILDEVNGIFKRSIDPDIQKYGRKSVLLRSIIPADTEENQYRSIQSNIIYHVGICKTLSDSRKYSITGIVWAGKTTWIASVVHDLINNFPEKNIAFFEAKKLNAFEHLEDAKKYWVQMTANKDIICVDGIDEISVSEIRDEFLKTVEQWNQQSNLWLIVTSRPQWLEDNNHYRFSEIMPDALFQDRIPDIVERTRLIYKLTNCCGKDFMNNPLLLTLIQLLHKETSGQWTKWQVLWIKPLKELTNLGEFYETITRLILVLQDREKSERRYHNDLTRARRELDRDLSELWKFALGIFNWVNSVSDTTTLSKLNLLYEDETLGLQFMHKSFLEFFAAREISQSDERVDEFFGIDRLDYRNRKEWARRSTLIEYLLGILSDTKKIEIMTTSNWLYRAMSVSSQEIDIWVSTLLVTARKNIYTIKINDFLNDTEIIAAVWREITDSVLYRKVATGATEENFGATDELMKKIIPRYLSWDTSLFKVHILTYHSKWILKDEDVERIDINNLIGSFDDTKSLVLLRSILDYQDNHILSLLTGLILSASKRSQNLFTEEITGILKKMKQRKNIINNVMEFIELYNYSHLAPYYKAIVLCLNEPMN